MAEEPTSAGTIVINYLKSSGFREVACDGVMGGPNPRGSLWSRRSSLNGFRCPGSCGTGSKGLPIRRRSSSKKTRRRRAHRQP